MTIRSEVLMDAISAAEAFIRSARYAQFNEGVDNVVGNAASGDVKRKSMDLTRALAQVRRGHDGKRTL